MPALDLAAYLARIGYSGPLRPDYETLASLLAAHMNAIHFENLDVLLGRPIRLDLDSLQDKLVREKRGGYCFEHGTLLGAALEAIGFDVFARAARIVMLLPVERAPRTHMFLVVRLPEGEFVLDPGFGGFACRAPIPLDGAAVAEGAERYRMVADGGRRNLEVADEEKAIAIWSAMFADDSPVDFTLGNHFTATHETSHFRQNLMMRALTPQGRVTVMNRAVTIRTPREKRTFELEDRAALRRLLRDSFGFDLPEAEILRVPAILDWA